VHKTSEPRLNYYLASWLWPVFRRPRNTTTSRRFFCCGIWWNGQLFDFWRAYLPTGNKSGSDREILITSPCQWLLTESFTAQCSAIIITKRPNFQWVETNKLINWFDWQSRLVSVCFMSYPLNAFRIHVPLHLKLYEIELQTTSVSSFNHICKLQSSSFIK